jgi:PAS domain S-box-containing protein
MQHDSKKTSMQLADELNKLRQRNLELEALLAHAKEAEEHLRAVSETALDAVIISDQDGTIVFWNKKATEIFGYEKEEVLGNPVSMLIPEEAMGEYNQGKEDVLKRGFSLFGKKPKERVAKRKDGTKFPAEFTVSNWKIKDRYYFGGSLRDISDQKRIEEESERILNMSQDLICIAGTDGYFKYVNPVWEQILGYPREHLLSRPFVDFIHPEDHHENAEEVAKLASGKMSMDFENRYIHKDGSIRIIQWTAAPLPEKGLMYCVGRDVTERKQHEAALREKEARFRTITESSPDAIIAADNRGKIIYWNTAAETIYGYKANEIVGKSIELLRPVEKRLVDRENRENFLKTGHSGHIGKTVEGPARRKDGTTFLTETSTSYWKAGDQIFFSGIVRDITERKLMEKLLQQEKHFSDTLINSLPGVYYLLDFRGNHVRWNKNLEDITGYSADRLQKTRALSLIHEDDRALVENKIKDVFKNGHAEVEARLFDKSGTARYYFFTGSRVAVEEHSYLTGLGIDITERKRMEQELKMAHEELEKKVKQRTVELANVNKELQTSKNYLKKFAGMLLSVREEERKNISTTLHDELGCMALSIDSQISIAKEECKENNKHAAFKALEKAQAALRKAVGELRGLAVNLRPPNLEIVGLNTALTDLIDKAKQQAKLKIIFRNELSNKKISEDKAIVIYRVIQEAVTNIIKHAKAKNARVRLYADNRNINLDITDDGMGSDLNKVFAKKGKLKIGIEGMRERIESLRGEFIITSAPKQGTQLKATLPKK